MRPRSKIRTVRTSIPCGLIAEEGQVCMYTPERSKEKTKDVGGGGEWSRLDQDARIKMRLFASVLS